MATTYRIPPIDDSSEDATLFADMARDAEDDCYDPKDFHQGVVVKYWPKWCVLDGLKV